jgi:DHA2 family multidrug resistance protein
MTGWLSQQFGRRNYFAAIVIYGRFFLIIGNADNIIEISSFWITRFRVELY